MHFSCWKFKYLFYYWKKPSQSFLNNPLNNQYVRKMHSSWFRRLFGMFVFHIRDVIKNPKKWKN